MSAQSRDYAKIHVRNLEIATGTVASCPGPAFVARSSPQLLVLQTSVVNLVLFTLTGYWKPHIGY